MKIDISLTITMATAGTGANPNEHDLPNEERQVMSPNAQRQISASGDDTLRTSTGRDAGRMSMNMDGETMPAVQAEGPTLLGASEGVVVNGTTQGPPQMQRLSGFLDGARSTVVESAGSDERAPAPPKSGFMGGLARMVQAVERSIPQLVTQPNASPTQNDAVEYASVRSSWSADAHPPSASTLPRTPLFPESTLQRMRQMERDAPLIYPQGDQTSAVGPPSASSSDIQAEVRRQLSELMALRDEEGRRLRAQVEALTYENSELRTRALETVQSRSVISRTESVGQGFSGFGWIGRGLGSLMGSSRALDLRHSEHHSRALENHVPPQSSLDLGSGITHLPHPLLPSGPQGQVPPGPQGHVPSGPQGHVPSGLQGQVPSGLQGHVPSGLQGQVPPGPQGHVPSGPQGHVPSGLQGQVLSGLQGQVPSGLQGQVPSGPQGQVPSGLQGQVPSGLQGQVPSGLQGQVPSGLQGQVPSGPQGQVPSGPQGQVPSGPQGQVPLGDMSDAKGVDLDPLSVVLTGMAQLQGIVSEITTSPKAAVKQEMIKPGVATLPELPPLGPEACLAFSDWLHNVKPALGDVSDSSEELWSLILIESTKWYTNYLKLDPLGRLAFKPVPTGDLAQPKWQRVSRRMETMILGAMPSQVKEEISSARVEGLFPLLCKLFVVYGPGSLTEREIGLRHIQDPPAGNTVSETIDLMRRWRRWCARMVELGGSLPDPALQVKAITKISKNALQQNPEVSFRVSLSRASLQIDMNPDSDKVQKLHAQILSELEAMHHRGSSSKDRDQERDKAKDNGAQAKVKGVEAQGQPPSAPPKGPKAPKSPSKAPPAPKTSSTGDSSMSRTPCTFYTSQNGCKKGADCTFGHDWNSFSATEKAQRCKVCGSKGHKSPECRSGLKDDKDKGSSRSHPKGSNSSRQVPEPPAPPMKDSNSQTIKSMLADAARILHGAMPETTDGASAAPGTATAVPMSAPPSQPTTVTSQPTQGTPVTLASLTAQLESLRSLAREHEIRAIRVEEEHRTFEPEISLTTMAGQLQALKARIEGHDAKIDMFRLEDETDGRLIRALALLDSGATHAVIPYNDSLGSLEKVPVTLAGDEKQEWLRTKGGTLVVPRHSSHTSGVQGPQTILPLGSLVETLGCQVTWSKRKGLKVTHPTLGTLQTKVSSSNCPVVQEDQALLMIAELESKRLDGFREQVQNLECKMKTFGTQPDPTKALQGLAMKGDRVGVLQAILAQPYLEDVSEETKAWLAEDVGKDDDEVGRRLLKALPLRRAKRRTLLQSHKWLVHLCAGPPRAHEPIAQWCDSQGIIMLNVDLKASGGKGWDLTKRKGVWRALMWAAVTGRIVGVFSSPPRRLKHGREGLFCQDKLLWSMASAVRGIGVPYIREIDPDEVGDHCSFTNWSGVRPVVFNQGVLDGDHQRKTCLLTNLDMSMLSHSRSEEELRDHSCVHEWSTGLRQEIVKAMSGRPAGATCEVLDTIISTALYKGTQTSDFSLQEEMEELRLNAIFEQESPISTSDEEECRDATCEEFPDSGVCEVKGMSQDALEGWKRHLSNGHVPYRRDCKQCVEGAALGHFHKKVVHPKLYSLSVDLFGPVPAAEAGRDEGCVTGKCILRYGLVGAFRIPKSVLKAEPPKDGVDDLFQGARKEQDDDLRDIDPSLPGDDLFPEIFGEDNLWPAEEVPDQEEFEPIAIDAVDYRPLMVLCLRIKGNCRRMTKH